MTCNVEGCDKPAVMHLRLWGWPKREGAAVFVVGLCQEHRTSPEMKGSVVNMAFETKEHAS